MYISEVYTTPPTAYENETERLIYEFLTKNNIEFHRVDTEEAIEMDMCPEIGKALGCRPQRSIFPQSSSEQDSEYRAFPLLPKNILRKSSGQK